ncbi:MAG TPA: FAD-dependent oxidoreductase, partial [Ktedonobacterales bacterium]|nr:FAD-dependent oxidoreductase [Ktedonobacterales bacterium]
MTSKGTAIFGGGALGLTLAWRLARAGERVVVYEREPVAGGLAAGFRVGASPIGSRSGSDPQDGPWLEKFYHHLFRTDRDAVALIGELGLADKLYWGHPNTSSLIDGRPWRLDGALPVLKFSPLPVVDRLRLGAIAALMKALPNADPLEGVTASAWLRHWLGPRAYTLAFEPLFRGKFGDYADEIAMPWFWARIHCRTAALGYLRGGFQQVYEALAAGIQAHGGEVRLGVSVDSAHPTDNSEWLVTTDTGEERFSRVVSTLPTRVTFRVVPDLPGDFRAQYDWGLAYGAHCLILELDRQVMKDVYWLSIADKGYPFLAAVEHTNYIPAEEYGGRHLLYLGNYLPMDHPLMRATPEEALD